MSQHTPNHGISWNRSRARVFRRKDAHSDTMDEPGRSHANPNPSETVAQDEEKAPQRRVNTAGQRINHAGHVVTPGIHPDGESGRSWIHPWHFLRICFRSSCTAGKYTNFLWPFTIAAFILYYGYNNEHQVWVFITAYIGMVPAANLVGFAGQELARKIPKVMGVLLETTFGSIVEIILFTILIVRSEDNAPVIRAAILGSILANMLLCLGLCFFVGGIFHPQQTFHEAVSEVGSNLMLVAGMGLVIPTIFANSLPTDVPSSESQDIVDRTQQISHATAVILLVAFLVYVLFQAHSRHGLYEDILEADEQRDHDRHLDLAKDKLTLIESLVALAIALTFVTFMAYTLVVEIDYVRDKRHLSDAFIGLILVPVVEKVSEHLTAIDEAYDNQMNFALSHVLGASIQTALLNTPIVVFVGWGLDRNMSLDFEAFEAVVLILAIIVVGNFLRDGKSDYLEGILCVFVYILIAIAAYHYPNSENSAEPASGEPPSNFTGAESSSAVESLVTATVEHIARATLFR